MLTELFVLKKSNLRTVKLHINDSSRPLIFLGSNIVMPKFTEVCEHFGIEVAGIMDHDYWGNTNHIGEIPVIGTEQSLNDPTQLAYYKSHYNFFCATNWLPSNDDISVRDRNKRRRLIDLIDQHKLSCISIVESSARISRYAKIGKGCFVDGAISIEPNVIVGDYTSIYSHTDIGHDSTIGRNCVIQRHAGLAAFCNMEDEVYFGTAVKALKTGATFGTRSFVHECIYLRRGTIADEVVSLSDGNLKRVKPGFQLVE